MADLAGQKTAYFAYTGLIESNSATRIASAFNMAVNQSYDEVYLCISSHGGVVADGVFLYNLIRGLPIDVTMHNIGSVSSIAAAIFVAADKRYCSQHGVFMVHPTNFPIQENMSSERLNAYLAAALADDQRTEDILRERTTMDEAILQARRFKDIYITSESALKFGLVESVHEFSLPQGHEILQI